MINKMICMFSILLLWSFPALAVPKLQLDIGGGYYNQTGDERYDDQTIIAPEDLFTLYALMEPSEKTSLTDDYYLVMSLFLREDQSIPESDIGSFTFSYDGNATIVDVPGPLLSFGNPGIPEHGVFPTLYHQFDFKFAAGNSAGKYDTQKNPGQFDDFSGGDGIYFAAFEFDTTLLSDDYSIHFDLYNYRTKAPFSHDAHDAQSDPPAIPEPGTMILLVTGMAGVAVLRKKRT